MMPLSNPDEKVVYGEKNDARKNHSGDKTG
jgi:hypothetical protein